MIKLLIKSEDGYSNYVLEGNNKKYEVNINFMNVESPSAGDVLYMPEKVLNEKVSLNYGPIEDNNIKEDELITLVKNNNKIHLQRFYG